MKYYKSAKDLLTFEEDTFHWECDEMLNGNDEIQS